MKAKLVSEGIENVLKPKSEAEIDRDLKKLSGDELYDLFRADGNVEFLERAAKKGITDIYSEDLAELLNEYPALSDELFPTVIEKFPWKLEKNKTGGYSILIAWWDELDGWFEENDEIDIKSIRKILEGDAFELFEQYDEEVDLTDLNIKENKIYDTIKSEIQNDFLSEVNEFKTLDDMFKYIGEHEDEYYELAEALKIAVGEAKAIADEDLAFKDLKNEIKNRFGFVELTNIGKDNLYRVPLSNESIIDIYKLENNYADKINYHPPRYGYQGDVDDVPEAFVEAIENKLADLK
jgi:hypothetical protein